MKKIFLLLTVIAAVSCSRNEGPAFNVVPYPNEVELCAGTFDAAGAEFHYSAEIEPLAVDLIECCVEAVDTTIIQFLTVRKIIQVISIQQPLDLGSGLYISTPVS